jgi:hypothetical protein
MKENVKPVNVKVGKREGKNIGYRIRKPGGLTAMPSK